MLDQLGLLGLVMVLLAAASLLSTVKVVPQGDKITPLRIPAAIRGRWRLDCIS